MRAKYNTEMRKRVLKFLESNSDKTVTAKDILEYLNASGIGANITSVYRYLDALDKSGQINKYVVEKGQQTSYQYIGKSKCSEHLHLKCIECGQVIHLDCGFMDEISEHVSKNHGFDIICENNVLYGKCRECAKRTK